MYKTKAKSKIKNTMWKIFTKEMVHKRMVQKLLSVGVSVSLMLARCIYNFFAIVT